MAAATSAQPFASTYGTSGPSAGPYLKVTLPQSIYRITLDAQTGEPRMPSNIRAFAAPRNWPAGVVAPTSYSWRVKLEWKFKPCPTAHSIGDTLIESASPLAIDFGDEIRGGNLTVYARTELNGKTVWGKAAALVLGTNPSREMVLKAYPPNRFGLIASKIGMAESGLRQFTRFKEDGVGGYPYISHTNDIGMMQLNPPSGGITSQEQVWNWRANVRRGLDVLAGKRRTTLLASRHATGLRRSMQKAAPTTNLGWDYYLSLQPFPIFDPPLLSQEPGSGCLQDEFDPDNLKLTQVERESIRRYNGGAEYAFVVVPCPDSPFLLSAGWEIDPTRGGVNPKSGDPDYVTHVLAAQSGFVIPMPSRPAASSTPSRRKHRRR